MSNVICMYCLSAPITKGFVQVSFTVIQRAYMFVVTQLIICVTLH